MDMTVYVVQKQMRIDKNTGQLVDRFDSVDKAERWGTLEYILSPSAHPFNTDIVIRDFHEKLRHFSDRDYLLLIGAPCLIGMATAIAARYNSGKVKILQWSGKHGDYVEISTKIY